MSRVVHGNGESRVQVCVINTGRVRNCRIVAAVGSAIAADVEAVRCGRHRERERVQIHMQSRPSRAVRNADPVGAAVG